MDEMVQAVASGTRAGVEITAELLKILAPALAKGSLKILGGGGKLLGFGIDKATSAISNVRAEGTVSRKSLLAEAAKENTEVRTTDSFPQEAAENLVAKAKEYHIPVSLNGEGASRSLSFLDRDKDVVAQIMQDWQTERLAPKENKQGLKVFAVSEQNVNAVKTHLEQNGIECWFTKTQSGEIHCNFAAENEVKVSTLMDDFKSTRNEIENNCKITTADIPESERQLEIKAQISELEQSIEDLQASATLEDNDEARAEIFSEIDSNEAQITELQNEYDAEKIKAFEMSENKNVTISDNGKSVEITVNADLRKSDVMAVLQEDVGYTPVQAELAANKLADELGLDENYYAAPSQMSNLEKMQVNIRYGSDDITIRDVSFSALKLKDGQNVRLNIAYGDTGVLIVPAELSDNELKTVFKEQLGLSDIQAEKAVSKARKIDGQIQSKLHETVYSHDDKQTVNIERTSQNAFIVKSGETTKSYEFSQVNLEEKIAGDFGIPAENAHRVVQKAQGQSVIQNKIRANAEKKRKSAKAKDDPFKSQKVGTGSKKVKR